MRVVRSLMNPSSLGRRQLELRKCPLCVGEVRPTKSALSVLFIAQVRGMRSIIAIRY